MHAESPINSLADITVFITCSLRPSYLIYVHEVDCKAYIVSSCRSNLLSIIIEGVYYYCVSFLETLLAQRRYDRSGAALAISLLQLIIK